QVSYVVSSGSRTLKWSYEKDSSASSGSDCGWVDQVVWTPSPVSYTVTFNANGGYCDEWSRTYRPGDWLGMLPTPYREGYVFDGWYDWSGDYVDYYTPVYSDMWLYADWYEELPYLWSEAYVDEVEGAPWLTSAVMYDGMLTSGGYPQGMIQAKVAKGRVDRKSGEFTANVAVTVQLWGEKITFKGAVNEWGEVNCMEAKGHHLDLYFGSQGMTGYLDDEYEIQGSRNLFAGKSSSDKSIAAEVLDKWKGALNIGGEDGVALSVVIGTKGKTKITGLVDGIKVNAVSQLLVGEEWCAVPIVVAKKMELAFTLWLPRGEGETRITGDLDWCAVGKPLSYDGREMFFCGGGGGLCDEIEAAGGELLHDFLPEEVSVMQAGGRWIVAGGAKAGKVAFERGSQEIDYSKTGDNPSGLKLTYKTRDGSFKGSYKIYSIENGKIKAYTVNVTGLMVNGVGYGTATIKKPDLSWPVWIE
ncbi:MAG: InlB B-repeat-containing protein, partial [Kiritimatiellae bacterium]|nr:InlB B-repeat-containing protein [Kiritimatiellia bacterium]